MKRKNIDAMREARLWIRDIVVPGVGVLGSALMIPEVREAVAAKANEVKEKINSKFKKNKSE